MNEKDMHRFRFLAKQEDNSQWVIEEDELFHLRKVLRLKVGTEVEVFNTEGTWGFGFLKDISNQRAYVEVSRSETEKECLPRLAVGIAVLQAQTMSDLLPCLVELGVDEVHIFSQRDSAKNRVSDKSLDRWNKIILSAMKQCKRARKPLLKHWGSMDSCLDFARAKFQDIYCLDADGKRSLSEVRISKERPIFLFIGSEKGLLQEELSLFKENKIESVTLGPNTLRAFTAAIAATSQLALRRVSI